MGPLLKDPFKKRSLLCNVLLTALIFCVVFFVSCAFVTFDPKEKLSILQASKYVKKDCFNPLTSESNQSSEFKKISINQESSQDMKIDHSNSQTSEPHQSDKCKNQCKPPGSEPLPRGIITRETNLEMEPLWGFPERKGDNALSKSLLAIAAGIKQKEIVNKIVAKFPAVNFTVMLFHYDGVLDGWRDLKWCDSAVHISALGQTKWWFSKRFLHPDVVAEYDFVFLWDEDLEVKNFDPLRYLSIVKREGLEISQPALDPRSQIHHRITVHHKRRDLHRRIYKLTGGGRCYENSTAPPCTGWVEMMAPVFSRAAWRCSWHMIQNDLIHAWGLDYKLGYCAQGDRSLNVGIVDREYVLHRGIPSLGAADNGQVPSAPSSNDKYRYMVRRRSYDELQMFNKRWEKAAAEDDCWTDPYPKQNTSKR